MDTVQGSLDVELPTRVSARGVIAGILVGLALAAMTMALGTAIGATAFGRTNSLRNVGVGFASWFLLSLVVGCFAGGWLASGAARALRRRDGVLHGIVTWAAIALISMSLVGTVMRGATIGLLRGESSPLGEEPGGGSSMSERRGVAVGAWGSFAALFLPMLAAIGGGVLGVRRERRVAGLVLEKEARHRRPIVTSPKHTGDVVPPRHPILPTT
jgi:hypothetical protein